jgi:4-amino-4-deoxy-L-arabinose transferase-like glycosyltransferase
MEPLATSARRPALALVAVVTVAYVAVTTRWLVAPLGPSHDGRNTATFALAARAMARLGLVGSHAGSVLADGGGSYAHHPPSLVWAIRVVQALAGSAPWTARLPTFLASVAVIWLLFGLLRDLGLHPVAAAVGTTVAVANPMFLLFGWMADTPMWSLPFALVATRTWVRAGRGPVTRRSMSVAILAAAACGLAGWQAVVWCGLLVVIGWRDRRPTAIRIALGVALGVGGTIVWIAASRTGLGGLADSFSTRSAGSGRGLGVGDALSANWGYLRELWSPVVLVGGLVALWCAWRDRRVRRLIVVAVVGVVGYAGLFWEAAGFHPYWTLWAVVAVAIAFAAAADALSQVRWGVVAATSVALVCAVLAPLTPTDAQAALDQSARLGAVVAAAPLAPDQPGWLLSSMPGSESWMSYVSDRPVRDVGRRATLLRLAADHPAWMMVLPCRYPAADRCAAMGRGGTVVNGVAVNRLSAIAGALSTSRSGQA